MEKYSEVIGLPVILAGNGKKAGTIKDIIFSTRTREVMALLLEHRGVEIGQKVILLRDVLHMGRDAVVIDKISAVKDLKGVTKSGEINGRGEVRGLRIYTKQGDEIGFVKDVLFDCSTGLIEGVEVSDGLFNDIVQGRKILPFLGKVEFAEENILVDREAVEEMIHSGGGLRKLFNTTENGIEGRK